MAPSLELQGLLDFIRVQKKPKQMLQKDMADCFLQCCPGKNYTGLTDTMLSTNYFMKVYQLPCMARQANKKINHLTPCLVNSKINLLISLEVFLHSVCMWPIVSQTTKKSSRVAHGPPLTPLKQSFYTMLISYKISLLSRLPLFNGA